MDHHNNYLFLLPPEIFDYLLTFLPVEDLRNMEKSSDQMRDKFVTENVWHRRSKLLIKNGKMNKKVLENFNFAVLSGI